jgi:hypothetical protein
MMNFKLLEKSRNRSLVTFHVLNDADDVVGSVGVSPREAGDLLRHWAGPKRQSQPRSQMRMRFPQLKLSMRRQAILRGCL